LRAGFLERRLRARVGGPLAVCVTDNTHTMLSFGRRAGVLQVRLHHMFLAAPQEVVGALADYVRSGDPRASAALDGYIQRHRSLIRRVPVQERQRRHRIEPQGEVHDLQAIFDELNAHRFDGAVDCPITWGRPHRVKLPRLSIKLGSYSIDARLIRIHPALDQPTVPRHFVAWIVYHEMLHHVLQATTRGGRRCVHTAEFAERERAYPGYEAARTWERENLDLLLWWRPAAAVTWAPRERSAAYVAH
jgi:hypothetical protein